MKTKLPDCISPETKKKFEKYMHTWANIPDEYKKELTAEFVKFVDGLPKEEREAILLICKRAYDKSRDLN